MSAVVIELRPRGIQVRPADTQFKVLNAVKLMCHGAGCNGVQRATVVQAVDKWFSQGLSNRQIEIAARALARQLVTFPNGPGAA